MKQTSFRIEMVPIGNLIPLENPRKELRPGDEEYEQIKASIVDLGFASPLIVNKGVRVVGGWQRRGVLKDLGWKEAPCFMIDVTEKVEKALIIALNRSYGKWDYPKLKDLIAELDDGETNMEALGFNESELEDLMSKDYGVPDLDELLNEVEIAKIVRKPIWLVVRADESQIDRLREIADTANDEGMKAEVSYVG